MALFTLGRLRITDSDGVPIPDGTARFRDAGTASLSSLFTDSGLTTPLTNPVEADATGWTPQIFAAEGTTCDVQFFDADGVEVPSQSFEDVVAVGADTGTFSRTFSGGTRMKISDSGGAVVTEYGDMSPDNTGGTHTEQGWNGTQGDTKTINFATTVLTGDLQVAGGVTTGGEAIPSVLDSGTQSAAANFNIAIPAGYHSLTLELYDIAPTNNSDIRITVSIDNASSYVAGVAYTSYSVAYDASASGSVGTSSWLGSVTNLSTTAGKSQSMTINLETPLSGTGDSSFLAEVFGADLWYRTGGKVAAAGRITNVKFAISAGTFTCKWRLRHRGS